MASPKSPGHQPMLQLPTLTDPNHVEETYANHVAGLSVMNGDVHITLSMIRPQHNKPGGSSNNEHVVVDRPVLPLAIMQALVDNWGQLMRAMQVQQATKLN